MTSIEMGGRITMKFTIKSKALILLSAVLLIFGILLGAFSTNELFKLGENLIGKQALSIVQTFSYQIDGDEFEKLSKTMDESDPYLLKLNKLMQQVKDETGSTYIYTMIKADNGNYMYIATSDEESSLGDTEDVTNYDNVFKDSMNKGTSGYTKVEPDPEYGSMLSAVVPIKNSSGKVVGILACDFLANTISEQINYVRLAVIIGTIIMLIISGVVTYIAIGILFKRLEKIIKATEKVANGDLTIKIDDNGKDEFGRVASNFNSMIEKLNYLIMGIRNISQIIDTNASNLSAISEEVCSSVSSTGEYIGKINKGISDENEALLQIKKFVTTFGNNLDEMTLSVKNIENYTEKISVKSTKGNNAIQQLSDSTKNVSDTFNETKFKIMNLDESLNKINDITVLINGIAEKTNLLALNSAIEAARAGEAGKGFSVVADEIRKLSEMTKSSANGIVEMINNISSETLLVLKNFKFLSEKIYEQSTISDDSMLAFKDIINEVEAIVPQIKNITNKAILLNEDKNDVILKVEASSEISKQIVNYSNEIYTSSQEINTTSEEVANSAGDLNNLTNDIIKKINIFKI